MSEELVLELMQKSILISAELIGPLLIISTIVGVLIGVFQTVTQIQEMTLTFIPKIIVAGLVLIILGPWMLTVIMDFSKEILTDIPKLIK